MSPPLKTTVFCWDFIKDPEAYLKTIRRCFMGISLVTEDSILFRAMSYEQTNFTIQTVHDFECSFSVMKELCPIPELFRLQRN